MSPPMHNAPQADTGQGDAEDGWLTHLACAVVCAGAPDPSAAAAPLDAPLSAPALRLWPRFATPTGMALAPLRRPPKLPTA